MLDGFAYVASHRRVRRLLLFWRGRRLWLVLFGPAARLCHGCPACGRGGYSGLLSANGFGALLGALTVATFGNRVKPRLLIFGGLWLFSFTLMLLAVVRWYPLVLLCLAVSGWGMMLYFATTNTLVQSSVSNAMRGRVMGIWALVFGGMMPLGGLESGFLSQVVGVPRAVAAGALVCAVAGLVMWWQVRRHPAAPAETQ